MVRERFDHEAGLDPVAVPALGMFKDTDPDPGER
jgi:hypothetical protein